MSKQAILKTLHYFDLFDYPPTAEEIKKFLPEPVDATFEETLKRISAGLLLICTDGYYCLPEREEIIKLRQQREVWSRPKLRKAKKVASILKFIPWIKLVGVTGALALANSDADDDIDLMIVTAPQRLWLTRGLVVTFLLLTGQYRRPGKIRNRICPNLMIGEEALEFPDRDLFTAHEIVQMKAIYDRGNTYQKFLQANKWVKDFLPNAKRKQRAENRKQIQKTEDGKQKLSSVFGYLSSRSVLCLQSSVLSFLERVAYKLQLKFMESKKTSEVTTPSVIRFHPQDVRLWVLDEYQKRVYTLPK